MTKWFSEPNLFTADGNTALAFFYFCNFSTDLSNVYLTSTRHFMKTQIIAIIPHFLKGGDHGRRKREESNEQVAGLTSKQRRAEGTGTSLVLNIAKQNLTSLILRKAPLKCLLLYDEGWKPHVAFPVFV